MNLVLPVLCIALVFPVLFAGTGKLFGDFCGVRHDSVTLLGACMGGAALFQGGILVSLYSGLWNALHGSSPLDVMIYCGGLLSLLITSFCAVSIVVLLIEMPARWLLIRGGHERAIPMELVRVLTVVLCLSASLGWIFETIAGYL